MLFIFTTFNAPVPPMPCASPDKQTEPRHFSLTPQTTFSWAHTKPRANMCLVNILIQPTRPTPPIRPAQPHSPMLHPGLDNTTTPNQFLLAPIQNHLWPDKPNQHATIIQAPPPPSTSTAPRCNTRNRVLQVGLPTVAQIDQ